MKTILLGIGMLLLSEVGDYLVSTINNPGLQFWTLAMSAMLGVFGLLIFLIGLFVFLDL